MGVYGLKIFVTNFCHRLVMPHYIQLYVQICCPSDRVSPPGEVSIRDCTEEESYDYYYDEDFDVNCKPAGDTAPKFEYGYNKPSNCPCGTVCTNGNKCGIKGNFKHSWHSVIITYYYDDFLFKILAILNHQYLVVMMNNLARTNFAVLM